MGTREGPHRVETKERIEICADGAEGPLAWATRGVFSTPVCTPHPKGKIFWCKFAFDELVFSHLTAMLVLQGGDLRHVFSARSYIKFGKHLVDYGPFYLLKGALSKVTSPPLRLQGGVVLAKIENRPFDGDRPALTDLEIVTHLIAEVLPK
jgi:hypothetical protein